MTKFLLRRRNRFGQFVHLETFDYDPDQSTISYQFGPGEYSILTSQEGIVGLQKYKDFVVPWNIEFIDALPGKPTNEYINDKYGVGNYFVLTNCKVEAFQIYPEHQPHDRTWENLQDGISAMKNLHIIAKVNMPWV